MVEAIRENAELVRKFVEDNTGSPAAFDAAALAWLDGFIQRMKSSSEFDDEQRQRLLGMFGCFLGECCIRAYGGAWVQSENGWQIEYDAKNSANPMERPWKCYDDGLESSLKGFFEALGVIRSNARGKRRWWQR